MSQLLAMHVVESQSGGAIRSRDIVAATSPVNWECGPRWWRTWRETHPMLSVMVFHAVAVLLSAIMNVLLGCDSVGSMMMTVLTRITERIEAKRSSSTWASSHVLPCLSPSGGLLDR